MKNQWKKVQLQMHYLRHVKIFGKFEVKIEMANSYTVDI